MRASSGFALALIALTAAGCGTSGDFRRVDVSADLASADLAHFQGLAKRQDITAEPIEDYSTGLPWWPLVWRDHETWASKDDAGAVHFQVEDDWGLGLWAVTGNSRGTFDAQGHNTGWSSGNGILLGAISSSSGEAVRSGVRVPTSNFRLLWGLFQTQKTAAGSGWRLFWIPFGD